MRKEFKIALLVISFLLIVSFLLPWAKTSSMVGMFTGGSASISGFKLVSFASDLNSLARQYGEPIWQLNLVYLYLLIPILSVVNIVLFFLNKNNLLKISSLVHFSLTILLCVFPIFLLNSDESARLISEVIMEGGIGYYLTFIGAIIGLVISIITLIKPHNKESDKNNREQLNKLMDSTFKALGTSKEELSKKPILHIGYLVFGVIMLIAVIIQIVKGNWYNVFEGLLLIGLSVLLYLKMPSRISNEVSQTFEKTLYQVNKLLKSFKISDKFISLTGNLIYLFVGILLVDVFIPYGDLLAKIFNTLATLSMYGLFASVILLLASKEFRLSHHGIFGYFILMFLIVCKGAFFSGYNYIYFSQSLKVLLYWTLSWYLLSFINSTQELGTKDTPVVSDTPAISDDETVNNEQHNTESEAVVESNN